MNFLYNHVQNIYAVQFLKSFYSKIDLSFSKLKENCLKKFSVAMPSQMKLFIV